MGDRMKETVLYQLKEVSPYMMSFVVITKENNAIVIDGGRPADMPSLKECVAGRHIAAWMEKLGAETHYVSCEGPHKVIL